MCRIIYYWEYKMKTLKSFLLLAFFISVSCTNDPDINSTGKSSSRLVKGVNDSTTVTLKYGEETVINEIIKIKFKGVTEDSRCPTDVVCIWEGNAAAELEILTPDENITEVLNSNVLPQSIWVSGIMIELTDVSPYTSTQIKINPEDYIITLKVSLADEAPQVNYVKLIDDNNLEVINKDPLQFNSAVVDGDKLSINVSYSGGCRTHQIQPYALTSIEKSNPARVSIMLSHHADNDVCEAYITKDYVFDLSALKLYVINQYNITDKVVLVFYDPEGNQIDKTCEYQFPQ